MDDFRLCIATCTYLRPRLTEAVFRWWEMLRVPAGVNVFGVAVGDYLESSDFWQCYKYPNAPLGRKHNAALWMSYCTNPDAVLFVGSDNIVTEDYIPNAVEAIRDGVLYTESAECYIWDMATDRTCRQSEGRETGAARMYSRAILDAMGWKLWTPSAGKFMDGDAKRNILRHLFTHRPSGRVPMRTVPGGLLNIKGLEGVNMWSYDHVASHEHFVECPKSELDRFEIERLEYFPEPHLG